MSNASHDSHGTGILIWLRILAEIQYSIFVTGSDKTVPRY